MKNKSKISVLFCCLLFYAVFSKAQPTSCGTYYFEATALTTDPLYASRLQTVKTTIQNEIAALHLQSLIARQSDVSFDLIQIPIVFHLIGTNAITNVSLFSAQNMITSLNNLYRKTPNTPGDGDGVDTQIKFCLATKAPNGNSTTGVINYTGPGTSSQFVKNSDATIKAFGVWDNTKYLNIWICDLGNSPEKAWGSPPALYFTSTSPSTKARDGVVCDMNTFNSKLLAHEIAHWLNLKHTYGDNGSSCGSTGSGQDNDDECSDTPWCSGVNQASGFGCSPKPGQCPTQNGVSGTTTVRQIENYMDDSDGSCKNMFTSQQKIRMQLTLSKIRTGIQNSNAICVSCNNGIMDPSETGIDCGGTCPNACVTPGCENTVHFKVNGEITNTGKIINVCNNGNIQIIPRNNFTNASCYRWKFLENTRESQYQGVNSFACFFRWLHQKWKCNYVSLFLSVQECDENKTVTGPEFSDWVDFPQNTVNFNLYNFLPILGATIVDGKYYKIKIASSFSAGGWNEYSSYIKVFKSNLTLSNKTIIDNQYADDLHIANCSVLQGSNIKVVASNYIEISPQTDLGSGSYYIDSYNCSQIGAFKPSNGASVSNELPITIEQQTNMSETLSQFSTAIENYEKNDTENEVKRDFKIAPNPTTGIFKLTLSNGEYPNSIDVLNVFGLVIEEINHPDSYQFNVDLNSSSSGVYFVRVNYQGVSMLKKLIKN